MQGPCKTLQQAGCGGKFTSNVQRDILRKVAKADPNQASSQTMVMISLILYFVHSRLRCDFKDVCWLHFHIYDSFNANDIRNPWRCKLIGSMCPCKLFEGLTMWKPGPGVGSLQGES